MAWIEQTGTCSWRSVTPGPGWPRLSVRVRLKFRSSSVCNRRSMPVNSNVLPDLRNPTPPSRATTTSPETGYCGSPSQRNESEAVAEPFALDTVTFTPTTRPMVQNPLTWLSSSHEGTAMLSTFQRICTGDGEA